MHDAPLPEIQWFNTQYIPPQDRLRLACALTTGGSETLWLTQRLANILVKKLLEWLDKQTVQDRRFADVDHRVAQKSALARAPKQAPGRLPPEEREGAIWLVRSVGINGAKNGLVLTFKDDTERAVRLRFDAQHLRQWLTVLSNQYRRAGWPTDVWPDWIIEASGNQPSVTSDMLH